MTRILILLIAIAVVVAILHVKIIQQSTVGIIMRLGKFHKKADTGVHFLVPFIDTLSHRIDLKEIVCDFPPQSVISKDNIILTADAAVYYQVTDPVKYVFEIANPDLAIINLTTTTLRQILAELDLEGALTSRDFINSRMRVALDEATDKWGVKVNRVELKNIMPPKDLAESMEKQLRAERERREAILQAEGEKQSAILRAEGEKQSAILRAEAKKTAMIKEAEGEKESIILKAQADAESIREVAKAKADGEAVVIEQVFKAMKEADIDDNMLALKSMEALEKIAEGESTKLVLPSDTVNFLGTFKGIKEVMKDSKEDK